VHSVLVLIKIHIPGGFSLIMKCITSRTHALLLLSEKASAVTRISFHVPLKEVKCGIFPPDTSHVYTQCTNSFMKRIIWEKIIIPGPHFPLFPLEQNISLVLTLSLLPSTVIGREVIVGAGGIALVKHSGMALWPLWSRFDSSNCSPSRWKWASA